MPSSPPATDIRICSVALIQLGAKAISSFIDGTDRSTACANLYPIKKDAILSLHDWKFTVTKQQLSIVASPISKWTNQFALPADRLGDGAIVAYPSSAVGAAPTKDFEITKDGFLTDEAKIFLDYQANNTSEANWPPYFVDLMVAVMEQALCMPITDQSGLSMKLYEKVYGTPVENGRGGMVGRAIARNSREDPPQVFQDFSLILARAEGS